MTLTANEVDLHVGESIRLRRESMGITRTELASHLGLTLSQVQKYENGKNRISAGRLYLLAVFLMVPDSNFFEGLDQDATAGLGEVLLDKETTDLAVLDAAFLSIRNLDKRQALMALVSQLVGPDPAPLHELDWMGSLPAPRPAKVAKRRATHVGSVRPKAPKDVRVFTGQHSARFGQQAIPLVV